MSSEDDSFTVLPDGTAFGVVVLPLPDDHWIYGHDAPCDYGIKLEEPPALLRHKVSNPERSELERAAQEAAMYAVKASTRFGEEMDFDPDAMVQNFVVGLLGYYNDE